MATTNRQVYVLCVGSADVTAGAKSLPDNEPQEFYVEIRLEPMVVRTMEAEKHDGILFWNEELILVGNDSATISFSVVQNTSETITQSAHISCVDIALGTLLARCADDKFAALEMTPKAIEANQLMMGILTVKLSETGDVDDVAIEMDTVGRNQLDRFESSGDLPNLENAISYMVAAISLTDERQPQKPDRLSNLGIARRIRFEHLGDPSDLEGAISNVEEAVQLTAEGHPNKPGHLSSLGLIQQTRFEHFGDMSDLENAISNTEKAVDLTDDGHPHKALYLSRLGSSQHACFEHHGNLADLENAISSKRKAVALTSDGYPSKPVYLSNLGISQGLRFKHLSDLSDLENAISNMEKAVELTDDGNPSKPMYLSNLGDIQDTCFGHLGNLSDLKDAVSNTQKAVELTAVGHPDMPMFLLNLGNIQDSCFQWLGNLSDLQNAISNKEKAVELTDDGHPDKPMYLSNLGNSQDACFRRLGNISDLEKAIKNKEKAVELTADGHTEKPGCLSNLAISQESRFKCLGNPSDLENAISNIEQAVELTDDIHPDKPMYLINLGEIQDTCFQHLDNLLDLNNAISNKERAVQLTDDGNPNKPSYLSSLGNSQGTRFECLGNLSDLSSSISNTEMAVELTDDEDPEKPVHFSNLGNSQRFCFQRLGDFADIENSISNMEKAVELTDDTHPNKPKYISNLGISQWIHFQHLNDLANLENAISNGKKAVELTDDKHPDKPMYLSNLGIVQDTHFEYVRNLADLENAILNLGKAVELTDDGHPDKPMYLSNLGHSQQNRFQHCGDLFDLEIAISNIENAVKLRDDGQPDKSIFLLNLGHSQLARFERLNDKANLVAAVSSFRAAAQLKAAYPSQALGAARQWAEISHHNGDFVSALDGYRTALELFPKIAWLGLNTHSRQDWLSQEKAEKLGCLAATCAIQLGQFEEAVELLDLGRSVFWQQASTLRSDLETLKVEEPELTEKLERVGHLLDAGNFLSSPYTTSGANTIDNQHSLQDTRKERGRLVDEWEEMVERVRRLPQFKYFLKPIPFQQLRKASTAGLVIVINASEYAVDALIFNATGPIQHVSLPDINLEILTGLSNDIVLNQPINFSETQQQNYVTRFLKPTLRTVWSDIVAPIFDRIHVPLVESVLPQCRIWWYPTGPLTFIPIHAAGSGSTGIDVSNLVISSYVITLQSLFRLQKTASLVPKGQLKLLSISQPNTPGQSSLPQTIEEVDEVATVFCSSGWPKENIVCLWGSEATVDKVSHSLESCSWVHFACHGSQDPILGMKSAFILQDGHLELGKIASKWLPNAQFAFLSACHAASGLREVPGEAMHLAAGVQFSGFKSVIATMWAIHDRDAPRVANYTYRYLFRNGLHGLDPCEAATALNYAVRRLRQDPTVTVDRWAPFIHFGI